MIQADRIADVMGGKAILGRPVRSMDDLETSVSEGLPKRALANTVERIYSTKAEIRRAMNRVVPAATYKRRAKRLSPFEGERTERLARVIAAAEFVLDDKEDAREWLTKPHPELKGRTPLDAAITELGARQVEDLLNRILYGLPA